MTHKNRLGCWSLWLCFLLVCRLCAAGIDENGNQQSDVWEMRFGAVGLSPTFDTDGDGYNNLNESIAGTNPRSGESRPSQLVELLNTTTATVRWPSLTGKQYRVEFSSTLGLGVSPWQTFYSEVGRGTEAAVSYTLPNTKAGFFRVQVSDVDTDNDGVSDWEELAVGFNPSRSDTDRYSWLATSPTQTQPARSADYNRINSGLRASSVVSAIAVDSDMTIGWPDAGVVAVKRTGGMGAITVPITLSGTAVRGVDYTSPVAASVTIPAGVREVPIELAPVNSSGITSAKTIVVTISTSSGYVLGTPTTAQVTLKNRPSGDKPSAKAAMRFLLQASFGADETELARVQSLGFEGWINDQAVRPVGYHQAEMEAFDAMLRSDFPAEPDIRAYGGDYASIWWEKAMKTGASADPLRQRVAYALSQILVISDKVSTIDFYPVSMANYYDVLLRHAYGNYRNLLFDVAMHPCMGEYLSHLRNMKEDPAKNLFPDENFAREILQLFSIGLWELNPDGTRKLTTGGQPIPTYTNDHIRHFAKVFTGLTLKKKSGNPSADVRTADYFTWTDNDTYSGNMEMWDYENWVYNPSRPWATTPEFYHDRTAKTLLGGTVLPANQRGMKDIADAIDNIMAHPNVGPFICRQLIQRLVTSNPSPAYIGRVSTVFTAQKANPNQMREVVKAILLDSEARDPSKLTEISFGKPREPYLRAANLIKTFKAAAPNGRFFLRGLEQSLAQRPLSSPSVFNFYLPDHRPAGVLSQNGLYAPEFQIMTDVAAISYPNYLHYAIIGWRRWVNDQPTADWIPGDFNPWGSYYEEGHPKRDTDIVYGDYTSEIALAADSAALLRRLDLWMTYGNLSVENHQIIREAIDRITPGNHSPPGYPNDYLIRRVQIAIYLISISPEFAILK